MDQPARDRILPRHSSERAGSGRPEPNRLVAPEELANYLGVPVKTLYQWRYKGVGPPGLRIGRHVRYRPEDVEAWLHRVRDLGHRDEVA